MFLCPPVHAQEVDAKDYSEANKDATKLRNLAIAQEIIRVGYPEDIREELFFGPMDQAMAQIVQASPSLRNLEDEGLAEILGDWMLENSDEMKITLRGHIPRMMDAMGQAYANLFTEQELADILQFASTSSGKKFLQTQSSVMSDPYFAAANQQFLDEPMAQIRVSRQTLKEQITRYLERKEENRTVSNDS